MSKCLVLINLGIFRSQKIWYWQKTTKNDQGLANNDTILAKAKPMPIVTGWHWHQCSMLALPMVLYINDPMHWLADVNLAIVPVLNTSLTIGIVQVLAKNNKELPRISR